MEHQFETDIIINGRFSKFGEMCVHIKIPAYRKDTVFRGIIDTGAYYSFLRDDIAMSMNLEFKGERSNQSPLSNEAFVCNYFDLDFFFADKDFSITHEFCVGLPNLRNEFILGTDFLRRCKKLTYDVEMGEYELQL